MRIYAADLSRRRTRRGARGDSAGFLRSCPGCPDLGGVTEAHAGGTVRATTFERTLVDVLDVPDLGGGWEEVWRSIELVAYFDLNRVIVPTLKLGSAPTCRAPGLLLGAAP